jgi:hypothetical protein
MLRTGNWSRWSQSRCVTLFCPPEDLATLETFCYAPTPTMQSVLRLITPIFNASICTVVEVVEVASHEQAAVLDASKTTVDMIYAYLVLNSHQSGLLFWTHK